MNELSITARKIIKSAPQRVFDAWLDPETMRKFMSPRPDMHVREARSDARVGGRFYVLMVGDKEFPHEGTYRVIEPYTRLVFTWEAPWSAPGTEVTILFNAIEGGTEVVLTQVKFMSEESRDNHLMGWNGILGKLEAAVS